MPLPPHTTQPFGALPWMLFLGGAMLVPLVVESRPKPLPLEDTLPGLQPWPVDDQGDAVTLFV